MSIISKTAAFFVILPVLFMIIAKYYSLLVDRFNRMPVVLQWILFIPASLLFSLMIGLFISLRMLLFNPSFIFFDLLAGWILSPLSIFFSISLTIPKGKKVFTIILACIFTLGCFYEILSGDPQMLLRVLQTVAMVVFIIVWARMPVDKIIDKVTFGAV